MKIRWPLPDGGRLDRHLSSPGVVIKIKAGGTFVRGGDAKTAAFISSAKGIARTTP